MGGRIKKDDVMEFLKSGGGVLSTLALDIYGESLNRVGETAFSKLQGFTKGEIVQFMKMNRVAFKIS